MLKPTISSQETVQQDIVAVPGFRYRLHFVSSVTDLETSLSIQVRAVMTARSKYRVEKVGSMTD